ncbi:MAG: nicotinate phosphoribosyltransferase [Ignavibacteriales bacterium]|nr:nicotinate phosphoribosyltransferase [Ignavibacteriales bacterium]
MNLLNNSSGIYTDYYQLTMAQGYFLTGRSDAVSCFDYFFLENPFHGGYVLFAGLTDVLEMIEGFSFSDEIIEYLRGLGLKEEFLRYLRSFKFRGSITSVREGEVVFPLEPLLRVEGTLIEAQLIETLLLNILNFESLIATKASRVKAAAGGRRVMDFGLRRAQGLGGIHATKAAIIGGIDATSNVYAAFHNDLEVSGTQAHSWVQSFSDELTAFRKFAEVYPDSCILLVDTYNTLRSGVPNAIIVAKELEQRGHRMAAIRLDSGDLAYLSKHARTMLDQAGLSYVKITVSNQLDEYVIRSLLEDQGAPIDMFGVGTRLVTGQPAAALDGVYKLSMCDGEPRLKFSENYTKLTLPGVKSIHRFLNEDGIFTADGVTLDGEPSPESIYHPFFSEQRSNLKQCTSEPLMHKVMEGGRTLVRSSVHESAQYVQERLLHLAAEHKRFEFPHIYRVGISQKLLGLRARLVEGFQQQF